MGFYKVNSGDVPQASDVNQYADGLQGNADFGTLYLADHINAPSAALTSTVAAGSGLNVGTYQYAYTYVTGYKKSNGTLVVNGETTLSPTATVTTTSGNQLVNLTNIGTSSASYVISRKIYRTKVNPASAPTLSASGTGNTLPAATYYVKYTWVYTSGGESLPSSEASQAVTSGQALNVTIPAFPSGVASANIYVSTSSGTETKQRNITTTSTSFTAPLTSGTNPPSGNTFYLLTTINDNVTTTYSDSIADTALSSTTAPSSNTTGTGFSKLNITNDGLRSIKDAAGGHLVIEHTGGYVMNNGAWATYLNANAYWDGTNWNRYDTTKPASAIVCWNDQEPTFRSIGAGANPITWNQYKIFHEGNFSTRTHVEVYMNSAQQSLSTGNWNRIKYDTKVIDYLNEFDTSQNIFTALNTGIYMISAGVRLVGLTVGANVILETNQINRSGNYYMLFEEHCNAATVQYSGTQVLYMNAGTQLEIRVQCSSSASADIGKDGTWLNISRVA